MKTTQLILDQVVLIVLNITLWQGRKALKTGDLAMNGIDVGKLPPGTLATLGSKRIISPKAVKIFGSLRRSAKKLCLHNGVRFGGDGYAVPWEKVEAVSQELKIIKEQFEIAKANFLTIYQEEVEQWIASNPPEWAPIIRGAVDSLSHIQKSISFNYAAIEIKTPEEVLANGLAEEVNSLYGQLCHEVRISARRAYESKFAGKKEVSQKTLRPIKIIREKLVGLFFLDPSIAETIQSIDGMPTCGAIKGPDLNMVAGLVGSQLANMGRDLPQQQESETEGNDDEDSSEEVTDEEPETEDSMTPENPGRVEPITWDF